MSEIYKDLTECLQKFEDIEFGKWYPEKQVGDGSLEHPFQLPFVVYDEVVEGLINEVYCFMAEHPEYELNRYREVLEKYNIRLDNLKMMNVDVAVLDGQGVMALLMAAIRAERFCDGILLELLKNGCIHKWLERLAEIDKQCGN